MGIGDSIDPPNEEILSKNNENKTDENLESTSRILPKEDNMEDTKKKTTNLVKNDIVEEKESLAVDNEKNTDLALSKSDNFKKTSDPSDPSDKSRKETSSKAVKSTKLSKATNVV